MEEKFNKLFNHSESPKEDDQSDFRDILDKKISDHYISNIVEHNSPSSEKSNITDFKEEDFLEDGSLRSYEYERGKHTLGGSFFSLTETPEHKTIIYQIFKNYNVSDLTYFYSCERLDSVSLETDDGKIERTFFVDILEKETHIFLITFNKKEGYVLVNRGFMSPIENSLKITSNPSVLHYDNMSISGDSDKEFEFDNNSPYLILDPETGEELPKKTYVDAFGKVKTVVTITPYKKYFIFSIVEASTKQNRNLMDAEDIGNFFYKGLQGFPKNMYYALYWFEKAKTKEAQNVLNIFMIQL